MPWSLMIVEAGANLTGKIKVFGSPVVTNDCRGRC